MVFRVDASVETTVDTNVMVAVETSVETWNRKGLQTVLLAQRPCIDHNGRVERVLELRGGGRLMGKGQFD